MLGQTPKKAHAGPADWPQVLPQKHIHGRLAQGLSDEYYASHKPSSPDVVRVRIGVDQVGAVASTKVLSGRKALVKDAESYLNKSKFPAESDPCIASGQWPYCRWQSDDEPYNANGFRLRVYVVLFSQPDAGAKP
jgi:hypothetical protein